LSDRAKILHEIKRIAAENSGVPPGKRLFTNETGITEGQWSGKYWARWSDAIRDAGLEPNVRKEKIPESTLFQAIIPVIRQFGRFPINNELRMVRLENSYLPGNDIFVRRFGGREGFIEALRSWCEANSKFQDVICLLPKRENALQANTNKTVDGWVYLIKSGDNFKIGRSDNLERRVKQISIALPETANLFHAIQTDDPVGIEEYWHKRFSDCRLNGEWFKLTKSDVAAFKRRKFQ
jgi:Meiotically up-regulated gene 113